LSPKRILASTTLALLIATAAPSMILAGHVGSGGQYKHYRNCTALNKDYPHGVGRPGARDHVSGSTKPVKNFYINKGLYRANSGSDRDGDGIACEKR
jgi:excalibur calcium-binding domain-containing protein